MFLAVRNFDMITPADDGVCDVKLPDREYFHQFDIKMNSFYQHPRKYGGMRKMLKNRHK